MPPPPPQRRSYHQPSPSGYGRSPQEGAEDPHPEMNRVGGNRLWMGGHEEAGQTAHPETMVETHPKATWVALPHNMDQVATRQCRDKTLLEEHQEVNLTPLLFMMNSFLFLWNK